MEERILHKISHGINDPLYVLHSGGHFVDGNERFCEMYGYTPAELSQLSIADLCAPDVLDQVDNIVAQIERDGQLIFETRHRRKDGTVFPVEVSSRTVSVDGENYRLAVSRDITDRVQTRERIQRLNLLYEAIRSSLQAILESTTEDEMYLRICRACTDYGVKMAWVGMVKDKQITARFHTGDGGDYIQNIDISIDPARQTAWGPNGTAVLTGQHVICNDFINDPRTVPWRDRASRYGWKSSAAFPLTCHGERVGALTLYSDTTGYFGTEEARLLDDLAQTTSFALERFADQRERQRLNGDLKISHLHLVRSLGRAGEYRDNETGAHILRMSHFCQILAETAGHSQEFGTLILHASPMHDVGKIGIPDSILLKPGKLTPEEFDIMKTHSRIGAEIIADANDPLLNMARTVALTHHEKWDGTGYPNSIQGTDIPLEGRIAALCDVFDALTSDRCYKAAWPVEQALAHINENAGSHFDPALVQAFQAALPQILTIKKQFKDH